MGSMRQTPIAALSTQNDPAGIIRPVPPGRYIDHHILEMRTITDSGITILTMAEVARRLGISSASFAWIRQGRDRLTPLMCLRLERFTGVRAEAWAELQWLWDLQRERERENARQEKRNNHGHSN